jgi:hypothetical protein
MFGNLFIKPSSLQTLPELGQQLSRELGFYEIAERESANYRDGHYLAAKCLGVTITLSLTDDDDLANYPFHLSMKADGYWVDDGDVFEGIADLMARKLTLAGYAVARCPDFGRIGAAIFCYSIKAGSAGNGRDQIDVVSTNSPPTPNSSLS